MKKGIAFVLSGAGVALLAAGLLFIRKMPGAALPYVCVGLGCGLFGHGAGELISRRIMKKHPEAARQMEVERKDERNVSMNNRAKVKAYDIMVPVYGALLVSFALMQADIALVLLLVAAYLFVCGCMVYYRVKYEKEM